ncbi:N-acyl-L-homoserine lactone synthetase [Deinobacterium chartae]|uniref:N-acyl-L-homoserine lactone synthetase n=1 Tax=Deinobacterium chartae TaxID=521158 RepID=A0A841HYN3_9DEIO|nr:hypothetical protein [Deinobacterium chartae]MBB6097012.1 N-acyl-L-homoserine lactone synthetase [Deinobacterium chartae]
MSSAPHGQVRLLNSTDPELLQQRVNDFLEQLPENAAVITLTHAVAPAGAHTVYSVVIHYKLLDTSDW